MARCYSSLGSFSFPGICWMDYSHGKVCHGNGKELLYPLMIGVIPGWSTWTCVSIPWHVKVCSVQVWDWVSRNWSRSQFCRVIPCDTSQPIPTMPTYLHQIIPKSYNKRTVACVLCLTVPWSQPKAPEKAGLQGSFEKIKLFQEKRHNKIDCNTVWFVHR